MDTIVVILVIVGITLALFFISWVLRSALNKGVDAASNAIKKSQEENNPPKTESLADRYKKAEDQNE